MTEADETQRRSCLECHRRKIKCDKSVPCAYCVKVRVECRYPPPRQAREKDARDARVDGANADVASRLDKIERTLEAFAQNLSQISQLVLSNSSSPLGRSRNDPGVSRAAEESGNLAQWDPTSPLYGKPFETNPLPTPQSIDISPGAQCSIPTATILSLWQTFLERVDPVLKMLHVPTTQKKLMDAMTGRDPASMEFQALVGSICYAAAITMSVEECWNEHSRGKEDLLRGYRATVERALTLADFQQSTNMTVLQAFTIYIICGRFDKEGPDVKNLSSIAVNIAQRNRLDKLENDPKISPFEKEARCRIWWQLYTLDVRNSEDHDLEPCILETSTATKLPLNLNDLDIHPDMRELPRSSSERTEMLFTLNRHEISTLVRRVVFSDKFCRENGYPLLSVSQKCDEIDKFRAKLEDNIFSLCNPDIPIDFITATSSRLVLAKLKLAVTKPQTRANQHIITQEEFRSTCVEILKGSHALCCYEKGKQWLWLFQTYVEWNALAYLFINLSLVPSSNTTESAWEAAESIYSYWKTHSEAPFDGRWKQIGDLRSQALQAQQIHHGSPAQFGQMPHDSDGPDENSIMQTLSAEAGPTGIHTNALGSQLQAAVGKSNPQPTGAMDHQEDALDTPVPSSGTACQWSAALFDRYFQLIESEHNMGISWI